MSKRYCELNVLNFLLAFMYLFDYASGLLKNVVSHTNEVMERSLGEFSGFDGRVGGVLALL
jgi:hypothetical protein